MPALSPHARVSSKNISGRYTSSWLFRAATTPAALPVLLLCIATVCTACVGTGSAHTRQLVVSQPGAVLHSVTYLLDETGEIEGLVYRNYLKAYEVKVNFTREGSGIVRVDIISEGDWFTERVDVKNGIIWRGNGREDEPKEQEHFVPGDRIGLWAMTFLNEKSAVILQFSVFYVPTEDSFKQLVVSGSRRALSGLQTDTGGFARGTVLANDGTPYQIAFDIDPATFLDGTGQ